MMNKLQRILIGILAVQLVLAVIVFLPKGQASESKSLLGVKAEEITGLIVTDDQGAAVKLAKSGDAWTAPDAAGYPASATKITALLTKLAAVNTGRLVGQTAAAQTQLQVADDKFVRKLELQTANGSQILYLGSAAGSDSTHVRLGGQGEVYLASGLATGDIAADLLSWIDPVYLSVPAADVTGLTLKNANGEWTFEKDAAGNWSFPALAAGETLNAAAVSNLLTQVVSLRLTKPLGQTDDAAYALAQPAAVVTLTAKTADQTKTYTLAVGAQDAGDKSYVVKSSESPYYVRVAEASAKDLVERTRAGFLVQPTPTPAAAESTPAP